MMNLLAGAIAATVLVAGAPVAQAQPNDPPDQARRPDGNRAIVMPLENDRARSEQAIRRHGGRVVREAFDGRILLVETPGRAPEFVRAMREEDSEEVEAVQVDQLIEPSEVTPNDTYFPQQWNMKKIGAPSAWKSRTGSKSVVVGVADTGIDHTHPDLAANLWTNPNEVAGNGLDDDNNGYVDDVHGPNCIDSRRAPYPSGDHGTSVAGIIGAVGNNARGVAGVNWNVQVMDLKFMESYGGWLYDWMDCMDYALDYGVPVSNQSHGYYASENELDWFIYSQMEYAGHLMVAAAGNGSNDNDSRQKRSYPASHPRPNIISVAAVDQNDKLSYYSNHGTETVDLAAPADYVYTTRAAGGYGYFSGTSAASPHVAGAAALLWSMRPQLDYKGIRDWIFSTVQPVDSLRGLMQTGGRLDLGRAVAQGGPLAAAASTDAAVTMPTFSPNGDGVKDKTHISARVNQAASWTLRVYETIAGGAQLPIREWTGSTDHPRLVGAWWDGRNAAGALAGEGLHAIELIVMMQGQEFRHDLAATIDTVGPQISNLTITPEARAVTATWQTVETTRGTLEIGVGGYQHHPRSSGLGTDHSVRFESIWPSEDYNYRVKAFDEAGNATVAEGTFRTLDGTNQILMHLYDGRTTQRGKSWDREIVVVTYDNASYSLLNTTIDLTVYEGACPGNGVLATARVVDHYMLKYLFKSRSGTTVCEVATASAPGYETATVSRTVTKP